MKDWKSCERRVAELLDGERVPVSGLGRGYSPDVRHERLSIEVNNRKKLPAWIEYAVEQAEVSTKDGQLTIAMLHQDGHRYTNFLIALRLKDFIGYAKGSA